MHYNLPEVSNIYSERADLIRSSQNCVQWKRCGVHLMSLSANCPKIPSVRKLVSAGLQRGKGFKSQAVILHHYGLPS